MNQLIIDIGNTQIKVAVFQETILIFKDGILEESFRAGLDLECPVTLEELQKRQQFEKRK